MESFLEVLEFLSVIQRYLIRKISAITAEILGIIFSIKNVVKLTDVDIESKSKIDTNSIINTEYVRVRVVTTLVSIEKFLYVMPFVF
ncbi:hypothetical protein HMPREF2137_04840 [Hoylesella buccalis DNF00853]|uniref:Uncharacterized protein n=1 Tax=Hoylesella buccalis DNF00853 TaxID=1401074 RepID=A0A096AXZ5_9BACT|nr:hypothetical protein HMPREF2137_04840 [Hoylesella buccalis DNF00853]KGF38200.1 hypothetical protein HMPREF2140_11480 [Hoylesella buccalis DNF00985]